MGQSPMRKTLQWTVFVSALTLVLLLLIGFARSNSGTVLASQEGNEAAQEHYSYSVASIKGTYAFVGTYAGRVAANWGVVTFDGLGSVKGSVTVNQPNADGTRNIVKVGLAGTDTVNPNGTGNVSFVVTFPDGHTANVTEDLVITKAEVHQGMLIATAMFEAQEQPSVVLSGKIFVTHTYSRIPD